MRSASRNTEVFERSDVVEQYAKMSELLECESVLFRKYLRPGMSILDLGVGGGRTTRHLLPLAARYVALDISAEMVQACKEQFSRGEFLVRGASDLSVFADETFDALVFSYNGLGLLHPLAERECCLKECFRVLKSHGVFIFSAHNSRWLLAQFSSSHRSWFLRVAVWGRVTARLLLRRVLSRAFWIGEGYEWDSAHGGITVYCSTPRLVTQELLRVGFQPADLITDTSHACMAGWYYYVFTKP